MIAIAVEAASALSLLFVSGCIETPNLLRTRLLRTGTAALGTTLWCLTVARFMGWPV